MPLHYVFEEFFFFGGGGYWVEGGQVQKKYIFLTIIWVR